MFSFISNESKLKLYKKVFKDHDYCDVEMPEEYRKDYSAFEVKTQYGQPFLSIYPDIESWKNLDTKHNPEKLITTKVSKHITYGYSIFRICAFDTIKKHAHCRGKVCMKIFVKTQKSMWWKLLTIKKRGISATLVEAVFKLIKVQR